MKFLSFLLLCCGVLLASENNQANLNIEWMVGNSRLEKGSEVNAVDNWQHKFLFVKNSESEYFVLRKKENDFETILSVKGNSPFYVNDKTRLLAVILTENEASLLFRDSINYSCVRMKKNFPVLPKGSHYVEHETEVNTWKQMVLFVGPIKSPDKERVVVRFESLDRVRLEGETRSEDGSESVREITFEVDGKATENQMPIPNFRGKRSMDGHRELLAADA